MGSRLTSKMSFPNRWKKEKKFFFQEKMKKGKKNFNCDLGGFNFRLVCFQEKGQYLISVRSLHYNRAFKFELLNNDCSNFNVQIDLPNIIQTDVTNVCSRISAVQPKSIIQHRVIFVLVVIYL